MLIVDFSYLAISFPWSVIHMMSHVVFVVLYGTEHDTATKRRMNVIFISFMTINQLYVFNGCIPECISALPELFIRQCNDVIELAWHRKQVCK